MEIISSISQGLKPRNKYKEGGWELCNRLGLPRSLLYVHHVVIESNAAMDTVVVVTNRQLSSLCFTLLTLLILYCVEMTRSFSQECDLRTAM